MNNKKIDGNINIIYDVNISSLIKRETEELKSLICSVKAKQIANLVDKDKNDVLFDKNIRKYLQNRGKVNKSIYQACIDENDSKLFWCLNNGITMVCDNFNVNTRNGLATVFIENLQIINGCQTSVTLYNAMKKKQLKDDTEVLVKIHAATEASIVEKITIATNNQNSINYRDLKANDEMQRTIGDYISEKYNLYYERKKNQFKELSRKEQREKVIKNEKLGQAYLAVGLRKPHNALGHKSDVFKKEYERIFKSSVPRLMFAYLIYRYVERLKKELSKDGINDEIKLGVRSYGSFHISVIMAYLLVENSQLPNDKIIEELNYKILSETIDLKKNYNIALEKLEKSVRKEKTEDVTVVNYLKRTASSKLVNKIVNEITS